MLSIGNKKYRNLQEQVGFNTEQIEKIFETIDGLNVQDNVVVVPDMSYILSQEELEIISREVAFIVYDNQLYIKKSEDASLAYFDVVFSISGTATVISFNSKEIQVTLSNGALGIVVSTVATYNQTQIDNLLSAKANITYVDAQVALCAKISGANFTGPITSPSIIENMSGYGFTKQNNLNWQPIYIGVVKNGNKATFVVFGKYTYATGDSANQLGYFTIPASLGQNLFPYTVGSLDKVLDQKSLAFFIDNDVNGEPKFAVSEIQKGANTYLTVNLRRLNSAGFTNGSSYIFRIEATFLSSDNLAQ